VSGDFEPWNNEPVRSQDQAPPNLAKKFARRDRISLLVKRCIFWTLFLWACGYAFHWLFVRFQLLP